MKEQNFRVSDSKSYTDIRDAHMRFQELQDLYEEINALGEIVKRCIQEFFGRSY